MFLLPFWVIVFLAFGDEYILIEGDSSFDTNAVYGAQNSFDGGSWPGAREWPLVFSKPVDGALMMIYGRFSDGFENGFCAGPDFWQFDIGRGSGKKWGWRERRIRVDATCSSSVLTGDILPPGRMSPTGFVIGTVFYVMGGWGAQGDSEEEDRNDVWKYDFADGTPQFEKVIGSELLDPSESKGSSRELSNSFHPYGKEWHSSVVDETDAYILFGYSSTGNYLHNDVWVYNSVTNEYGWVKGSYEYDASNPATWPEFPPNLNVYDEAYLPRPRSNAQVWISNKVIYAWSGCAGHPSPTSADPYFSEMVAFNVTNDNWAVIFGTSDEYVDATFPSETNKFEIGATPGSRSDSVFFVDPANSNYLWLFGGILADGSSIMSDLWAFSIADGLWTFASGSKTRNKTAETSVLLPMIMGAFYRMPLTSPVFDTANKMMIIVNGRGYGTNELGNINEVWGLKYFHAAVCDGKTRFDMDVCGGVENMICVDTNTCVCTTSFYLNVGECLICEPGYFCTLGVRTACPSGQFSDLEGSESCTKCERGSYQPSSGQSECLECPAGTYGDVKASVSIDDCIACSSGEFSLAGSDQCTSCPGGTYSRTPPGGDCHECPVGTAHNIVGSSSIIDCSNCIIGYYAASTGQSSCDPCPLDTYVDSEGSSSCISCDPGLTTVSEASNDITDCVDIGCELGYFVEATLCSLCPIGTYGHNPPQSTCIGCQLGTWSDAEGATSNDTCNICNYGQFADEIGSKNCKVCGVGSFNNGDITFGDCKLCPAGTWSDVVATEDCVECGSGWFGLSEGSTSIDSCSVCPTGTWSNSSVASFCTECGAGRFNPNTGSSSITDCQDCPIGTFSSQLAAQECTSCDPGLSTLAIGSTSSSDCVNECDSGEYISGIDCFPCQEGSYGHNPPSNTCVLCPKGTWSSITGATSSDVCVECGKGTWSDTLGASDESTCIICAPGTYSDVVGSNSLDNCTACPMGTWSNVSGATSSDVCVECGRGTWSDTLGASDESTCEMCAPGTYSDFLGSNSLDNCTACPMGTWSNVSGAISSDVCVECGKGTWSETLGGSAESTCEKCAIGTFSDVLGSNSSANCIECPVGTFSNVTGSNKCHTCSLGTVANSERSACVSCQDFEISKDFLACECCPPGRQPVHNQSLCETCPSGQISSFECELCSCCPPGTYPNQNKSYCMECPPGQVSIIECTEQCQVCSLGYYASGSISCEECPVGLVCQDGLVSEYVKCFGIPFNSSDVCNNHGECDGPDHCSCEDGWDEGWEEDCGITSCGGVRSDSFSSCSGRGNCTEFDRCQCFEGATGDKCEIFYENPPTISVEYLEVVGACAEGLLSCMCIGYDASFIWDSNLTDIALLDSNEIVLPSEIPPGLFSFAVYCEDFWGRRSNEEHFVIEKVGYDVPSAVVSPEEISVFPNDVSAMLEGFGHTTCSATAQDDYIFLWEQVEPISAAIDFSGIDTTNSRLVFENGFPVAETKHHVQFSVSSPLSPVISSRTVVVQVFLRDLLVGLNDSSRSVPRGYAVVISAENSIDPDDPENETGDVEHIWVLQFQFLNGTIIDEFDTQSGVTFTFVPRELGEFTVEYTFKKGERRSERTLDFHVFILPEDIEDQYIPIVWIENFQHPVNPSEKLVITGHIGEHEKAALVEFLWECVGQCDEITPLEDFIVSEDLNSLILILKPNTLLSMSYVMFKLTCTYKEISVFSTVAINVNIGGPTSGTVSIYPMENYVFENFQIQFTGWVDDNPPLAYSIYFHHCITSHKKVVKDWTPETSFEFSISSQGCRIFDYEVDLVVLISDYYGAVTSQTHKVKVKPVSYENIIEFILFVIDMVSVDQRVDQETFNDFVSERFDLFYQVFNLRSPNCTSLSFQEQLCLTIDECHSTDVLKTNYELFSEFQVEMVSFFVEYFPQIAAANSYNTSMIELFKLYVEVVVSHPVTFSEDDFGVMRSFYHEALTTDFKSNFDLDDLKDMWTFLHVVIGNNGLNISSIETYEFAGMIIGVLMAKLVHREVNVYLQSSERIFFSYIKDYTSLYKENKKLRITSKTIQLNDVSVKIPNEVTVEQHSLLSMINTYVIALNESKSHEIAVFFSDEIGVLQEKMELIEPLQISFAPPPDMKKIEAKCFQTSLVSSEEEEEEECEEVEIDEVIICKCNKINAVYRMEVSTDKNSGKPSKGGENDEDNLTSAEIVGIVLSSIFFALLVIVVVSSIILVLLFLRLRRMKKRKRILPDSATNPSPPLSEESLVENNYEEDELIPKDGSDTSRGEENDDYVVEFKSEGFNKQQNEDYSLRDNKEDVGLLEDGGAENFSSEPKEKRSLLVPDTPPINLNESSVENGAHSANLSKEEKLE